MWRDLTILWIFVTSIFAFNSLKIEKWKNCNSNHKKRLFINSSKLQLYGDYKRNYRKPGNRSFKKAWSKKNTNKNVKQRTRSIIIDAAENESANTIGKKTEGFRSSHLLLATKDDHKEEDVLSKYKIFDKKKYIKKYEVTKEEIKKYAKQLQECRTSGYEPQFPKDVFRTPEGLTNIILNYKYKNDNLKIHNYYFFFIYFLKKLAEKENQEENVISVQDFLFLKKKGFFEGEFYTWKNWVIMNRGEWKDFLDDEDYDTAHFEIKSLRTMIEPKMKRMPIEYWGSFRAIDFNINHYPIYKKLFDYFNKKNVSEGEAKHPLHPLIFFPRFSVRRDRGGIGYGDANFFGNYGDIYEYRKKWEKKKLERLKKMKKIQEEKDESEEKEENEKNEETQVEEKDVIVSTNLEKGIFIDAFDFGPNEIKVEEATDIIKYPQNGRLYQKFYIGPLNITDGHTFGSLLKYVCQSQIYGYAIVAIKIHNMDQKTKIKNVQEDLLEIALNMSDVCIYSKEQNLETNVRLRFKGPLLLVAGMIPLPSHLKIVNKEQYICTIKDDGLLDISLKIEYGKGHWLTYEKGLYKRELGSDNECMKKREVHEVVHKNYYPIYASFGACRMVRMTVHKIATKYWCEDRCEFTDPKQMLVLEIWCDPRMMPKNVLLYGIKNIKKIFAKFRQMILSDTDFSCEEEEKELKKLWTHIDYYKFLKRKQTDEGGPPIINMDEELENQLNEVSSNTKTKSDNINSIKDTMNPFLQRMVDPENFPKHSNITLPLRQTPPPFLDTLEWLKQEVKKDKKYNRNKSHDAEEIPTKKNRKEKKQINTKITNQIKNKKKKQFNYDEFLNERLADILNDDSETKT